MIGLEQISKWTLSGTISGNQCVNNSTWTSDHLLQRHSTIYILQTTTKPPNDCRGHKYWTEVKVQLPHSCLPMMHCSVRPQLRPITDTNLKPRCSSWPPIVDLRLPRSLCSSLRVFLTPVSPSPSPPFNSSLTSPVTSCFYCKSILLIWSAPMGLARGSMRYDCWEGSTGADNTPTASTTTTPPQQPPCGVHQRRQFMTLNFTALILRLLFKLDLKWEREAVIGCLFVKCTLGAVVHPQDTCSFNILERCKEAEVLVCADSAE